MYWWAIRLQNIPTYDEKCKEFFTYERFTRLIRVHHLGKQRNNPHWHFCVECEHKQDALRKAMNRKFDLGKGNKHISIKAWDGELKAVAYMFHEGTEPDLIHGFDVQEIETARQINITTQKRIKDNAPTSIVQEASEYFIENENTNPNMRQIFDFIYDRLRANGNWLPNRFQFERWAMRIQANIRNDRQWSSYKEELFDSMYGGKSYVCSPAMPIYHHGPRGSSQGFTSYVGSEEIEYKDYPSKDS